MLEYAFFCDCDYLLTVTLQHHDVYSKRFFVGVEIDELTEHTTPNILLQYQLFLFPISPLQMENRVKSYICWYVSNAFRMLL